MIESASTADPLFWLIHPVIERLVSAKRLPNVTSMGSLTFSKWDSISESDWLEYSYYSFDASKFNANNIYCHVSEAAAPVSLKRGALAKAVHIASAHGIGAIFNYENNNSLVIGSSF